MISNLKFTNFKFIAKKTEILIFCTLTVLLLSCIGESSLLSQKTIPKQIKILNLINISPRNNSKSVKRNAKVILEFNTPLDPLSIKTNSEENFCFGTIQISSNNFRTCMKIDKTNLLDKNKKITLSSKSLFKANSIYKIRLTRDITAKNGTSLTKEFITSPGFRTSWSQQFGTSGDDSGIAISVDKKDNIYLTGYTNEDESGEKKDLFLAKFVTNGYKRWIIQSGFERTISSAVLKITDSNKIIQSAFSNEKKNSAILIANYSLSGKKIFTKKIILEGKSKGNGISLDREGNLYVTAPTPFDILKIGLKGEKIWGNQLNSNLKISSLTAKTSNYIYITGSMKNSLDGNTSKGGSDIFLIKISQMGPKIWSRTFGSKKDEFATSISVKSEKDIAITGYVAQSEFLVDEKNKSKDAFVANYNAKGDLRWIRFFKGINAEECTVSIWTREGDLIVGGFTESVLVNGYYNGKEDVFLAKFSNKGDLIWLKQFGTNENERPLGIALGNKGEIYITGFSEGNIDGAPYNGGRDIFIVKYDKNGEKQ